jgi:hypothetical protein
MNSAITTLSLLASMDGAKSTIFENYIPLIKYVAITHNMTFYDESLFHNLFMSEFQLDLPSYVLQYILTKSMNKGMIKKDKGRYRFTDKALKDDRVVPAINNHRRDFASNITELTGLFNEFSKAFKDYNKVLVTDDFEKIVYANTEYTYYHAFRDKIVRQNSVKKLSSQVEDDYMYARFIEHLSKTNTYMFNTIIDISFGYSVSELLFCPEFDNHVDFKGLDCYFDTRIMLYLLGAEGSYYHDSMNKLLSALHKTGARLHIFKHTYEEILDILQICLKHWDDYDPYIAPSTLVYFKRNRKPKTDLEIILLSVENALNRHNIDIVAAKFSDEYDDLKTKITQSLIKRRNSRHLFEESSAERDARSIISILIDRDKLKPKFLKDAKSIFITSSITLIECLTQLEYVEDRHIAPCHSDMFIGSLLWLLNRGKYEQINKSLFAAIATSINSLNKSLLERFTVMFKDICQKENVDEALIQSFLQDIVLHDILENHTLNNIDRLTAEEVERIKDEYIKQLKDEEIKKTEQVTQERDEFRGKYENSNDKMNKIRSFREGKEIEYKRKASVLSKVIICILRPFVFIMDFLVSWLAAYFLEKIVGNIAYLIAVALLFIIGYLLNHIVWMTLHAKIRALIFKEKIKRLNKTIPADLLK